AKNRDEQEKLRAHHAGAAAKLVPLVEARAKAPALNYEDLPQPQFKGVRTLEDFPLATLRDYIDWSPFVHTWELRGVYPKILEHEKYGEQARALFADANKLLDRIITERLITAKAVYGFFPANSRGDDVIVWTDESRTKEFTRFHFLRQQTEKTAA